MQDLGVPRVLREGAQAVDDAAGEIAGRELRGHGDRTQPARRPTPGAGISGGQNIGIRCRVNGDRTAIVWAT